MENNKNSLKLNQPAKSMATRKKILDSTVSCLSEFGVQNTTLAKISRNAGLTWGAVQHHFSSKVDVLQAMATREFGKFEKKFDGFELKEKDLLKRVSKFIDMAWSIYSSPSYKALLELLVSLRVGDELYDVIYKITREVTPTVDHIWFETFKDTALTKEEQSQICGMAFATLRGLSVALFHGDEYTKLEAAIIGLKQTIYTFMLSRSVDKTI